MDDKKYKNILIVQIGKIGDMILTTPLFTKLKELFPDSGITVLASPINAEIAEYHKFVDNVIVYHKNLLSFLHLIKKLRKNKYDLWIDTKKEFSRTSSLFLKFSNPEHSAGFNSKKNIFEIDLTKYCNREHSIDINLSILKYFGVELSGFIRPSVYIPKLIIDDIEIKMKYVKGNTILINISSGNMGRFWKRDNWVRLIEKLREVNPVIITGVKQDEEMIQSIFHNCKGKNLFYLKTESVLEFAGLIERSKLLISPDTSAVHFASCFDTPVIAFYNNVEWNYKRFAPLSTKQKVFISSSPDSLDSIPVNNVLDAVNDMMKSIVKS